MNQSSPGKNAFAVSILATIVVAFVVIVQAEFLGRHAETIVSRYGWWILGYVATLMLNVYGGTLWLIRALSLAGSGRALRQVDHEVQAGESVLAQEMNERFTEEEEA